MTETTKIGTPPETTEKQTGLPKGVSISKGGWIEYDKEKDRYTVKGTLILKEDTIIKNSLVVEGDIVCKGGNFGLKVEGMWLNARNIRVRNFEAEFVDADSIEVKENIKGHVIDLRNLPSKNAKPEEGKLIAGGEVIAEDIYSYGQTRAKKISAVNLYCGDISAEYVSGGTFYARDVTAQEVRAVFLTARNITAKEVYAQVWLRCTDVDTEKISTNALRMKNHSRRYVRVKDRSGPRGGTDWIQVFKQTTDEQYERDQRELWGETTRPKLAKRLEDMERKAERIRELLRKGDKLNDPTSELRHE
jgi:phage baseplate assembly protein gpV